MSHSSPRIAAEHEGVDGNDQMTQDYNMGRRMEEDIFKSKKWSRPF